MFNTYNGQDLSQLMLGRSLRNNNVLLFLIKGLTNLNEQTEYIKYYSSKCKHIYYNNNIDKPTYDETQSIMSKITALNNFNADTVKSDIATLFRNLDSNSQKLISDSMFQVFKEVQAFNKVSVLKNGYICTLNILVNRIGDIVADIQNENGILYIGKPDKFDILAFTVLGLSGVDVVICDFTSSQTSECLCSNRFVLIGGNHTTNVDLSFLSYSKLGVKNIEDKTVFVNSWVNFDKYTSMSDYLNLLNTDYKDRFSKNKWNVLNICLNGVDDVNSYSSLLVNFISNIEAIPRRYEIMNNGILKATYEETNAFTTSFANKSITDIFASYPVFVGSGIPVQVSQIFDEIEKSCGLEGSKLKNHLTVLKIWLIRYLNRFYSGNDITDLPLIIMFGNVDIKDKDFLKILSLLPVDILCLNTNFMVNQYPTSYQTFSVGKSTTELKEFPKNAAVAKVSTVAYNAERELDDILYNDTTLFRVKQFKKINPIILKTTYEEIGILWNEVAKVRQSFDLAGNLVTVPTIFAKVVGVTDNYVNEIKRLLCNNNTILFSNNSPLILKNDVVNGQSLRDFAKQLVFNNEVDYGRLVKSKYYTYGVYSEETQELIREKADKLIHMNWCVNGDRGIVYDIIDTVFRLPANIVQMIHNYDFTADIPKVIMYNGGSNICSVQECITLMFLSLIGFDVVIFAPTGYRIVEHCINSQLFNEITIGQYDFNLENIDFSSSSFQGNNQANQKKKGFWSKIFE